MIHVVLLPFLEPFLREEWITRFALLLIVSVGMSIAYCSSHFNFGVSGQMALGAFLTILVAAGAGRTGGMVVWLLAGSVTFLVLFTVGFCLSFISHHLKMNEFLSTWMLSQALTPLLEGLILSTSLRSIDSARLASFRVPWQFSSYSILAMALIFWILWIGLFYRTKLGLALKMWASDKRFILSLGFNPLPFALLPLSISVALMGIAGFLLVSSLSTSYTVGFTSGWDILGITASLMVSHSPLGIVVSSLFLSYLLTIQDLLSILWGWGIQWAVWIQLGLLLIFTALQAWRSRRRYA